jgi:hypothetical protein
LANAAYFRPITKRPRAKLPEFTFADVVIWHPPAVSQKASHHAIAVSLIADSQ